jgi:hypothetical protein
MDVHDRNICIYHLSYYLSGTIPVHQQGSILTKIVMDALPLEANPAL